MRREYRVALAVLIVVALAIAFLYLLRKNRPPEPPPPPPPGIVGLPEMKVKPKPQGIVFKGCPPEGDGGDPVLNRLKNRIDEGEYFPVPFEVIANLAWPKGVERRFHSQWSGDDAAAVERYEGIPIAVEGYLARSKEEGPESPNCHGADHEFRDFHVWLTKTPDGDRSQSIVVEVTPRVRVKHPNWTTGELGKIARDNDRVRISGWLMLDPEHPDQIGKTRGTIWEIHPIMRIEVERQGRWQTLN
jgi:hypothetical protein